jgi:ABC-type arginine transport system ATPase subunit
VTGSSGFRLCGFLLVLQASFLDCVPFDPFSFQQDCLTTSEVDVGRCQIAQALMIAPMAVVIDEPADAGLEITPQVVCGS